MTKRLAYFIAFYVIFSFTLFRPSLASHIGYTIAPLYTTATGPFSAFKPGAPSLNSSGTLAFRASLSAGGNGIYAGGGGGPATPIASTSGPFSSFRWYPTINSSGVVAFSAWLDAGGEGIYTSSGGLLTTIADTSGPFSGFGYLGYTPSINSSSAVAFWAQLDSGEQGIYTGNGGPVTTIADTTGPFSSFSSSPSINSFGTVAFAAGVGGDDGIYTGNGGPITTIADISGPFRWLASPSINSSGTVAFVAGLDGGGVGIFTGNGGPLTAITDTSGPFSWLAAPTINSSGSVAFMAELDAPGRGIFTFVDGDINKVVLAGESILGSRIANISFGRQVFNDVGQVTFLAKLKDGTVGVFLATPGAAPIIPEPCTLTLLGVGLAGIVGVRRCRRKDKGPADI